MTALAFLTGFTFFLSDQLWVMRGGGVSGGRGKPLHFHICNIPHPHHLQLKLDTHTLTFCLRRRFTGTRREDVMITVS